MNRKLRFVVAALLLGMFTAGSVAQGPYIRCKRCTRFPDTTCWPESDWQDLEDSGCLTDQSQPCAPNVGRRYTISWTGRSILELPDERVLWCRGATAAYQACKPGSVLYTYYRGCPPIFYPPVSAKGSFVAEASRGTAASVLQQWCGQSGVANLQPQDIDVRMGFFIPYLAAVSCGDSFDHSSRVEVTRLCR